MKTLVASTSVLLIACLMSAPSALAQHDLPETTDDGLELIDSRRMDAVYWRPGASLAPYERIKILDVFVAFRKDWQRDQNRERGLYRVTDEDMERIRSLLAEEFVKEFERELQERGDYELTEETGEDVLLLRPAIVNLDVYAPDIEQQQPGITRNYVASAGEMTLYMELYDSATNAIIGRVIDRREGTDAGGFQISNSVTNRSEADRILRAWADTLREALDAQWSGEGR